MRVTPGHRHQAWWSSVQEHRNDTHRWDVVPENPRREHWTIRPRCSSRTLLNRQGARLEGIGWVLFVGDDWAEDHKEVELQDQTGRRLKTARVPEGAAGLARLHELIAEHSGDLKPDQVWIGIETDRGPWVAALVAALVAAGYRGYAINPRQAARFSGTPCHLGFQERCR